LFPSRLGKIWLRNGLFGVPPILLDRSVTGSQLERFLPGVVALLFCVALCALAPLGSAFQFGGDEGYELMKGLLLSRGRLLYSEIWSDQPPVHTALLAALFHFTGPSILAARLLSVAFGGLLIGSLYELARRRSGHGAALLAAALLIPSSYFLQLAVSAMIVLPAFALGLFAVVLLDYYVESRKAHWLALSGLALGLGLQTKLTAGLVVAPAAIDFWLRERRIDRIGALQRSIRAMLSEKWFCFSGELRLCTSAGGHSKGPGAAALVCLRLVVY
jgi:4-amino-4-deoxy-L-arabinose transferase-like glycosyltransferase